MKLALPYPVRNARYVLPFTLWLASLCLPWQLQAQDQTKSAPLAQFLNGQVTRMSVGVTRAGTAIPAWLAHAELDNPDNKQRVLIVAGLDGSTQTTAAAEGWMRDFYALAETERAGLALSAIPCGNPDGQTKQLKNDNGVGGNPAGGYPPPGEAYLSPTSPESQYLWRWLGMAAPDLVIELIEAKSSDSVGPVDLSTRPADSLAVQLNQQKVGGIGSIRAMAWAIANPSTLPIEEMKAQLRKVPRSPEPGSARWELQRRAQRSPELVASQLAKVYGHELPTPAYIPAVACMARLRWARQTDDPTVLPDLLRITNDYYSDNKPLLTEKSTGSDIAGHILWGELYDATQDPRYIAMAQSAADRAFDDQGQPRAAMPTHSEMSDAVFMGCPILAQVGRLTGQTKYFDMCLTHMRFMLKLNLRSDGLHRHSPLDETAWGRGNGFPALGLALALEDLPESHPGRAEMLNAFRAHLAALLPHQDATGAWHQVVDHPESYRELTSTCMITYAMIRGVRRGWLDASTYEPALEKGWKAITLRVGEDGSLVDVCTGTGKMKSLREYLDRTAILGRDPRGGAMALLVATEMMHMHSLRRNRTRN